MILRCGLLETVNFSLVILILLTLAHSSLPLEQGRDCRLFLQLLLDLPSLQRWRTGENEIHQVILKIAQAEVELGLVQVLRRAPLLSPTLRGLLVVIRWKSTQAGRCRSANRHQEES